MTAYQVFAYVFLVLFLHSYVVSSNKILPHMEFLKPLIGIRKGDNVKGVDELKKHLTYLGYLNYNNCSIHQTHESNNVFDNSLELALKKYQKFYNLSVTGVLNANTVAKMQEPRCGMPDFYNCNNVPFVMASRYAFIRGRPRWRKRNLTYYFYRNTKKEAIAPLERAMQEWASVTHFKFFRVKNFERRPNIKFGFMNGYHGDKLPFDGPNPAGGVAHSFPPPNGRVHFDAAQTWSNNGDKNAFDITTVGLHELGHVLGLHHSEVPQAVMWPIVALGEIKNLHEDDIKGIKALYKLNDTKLEIGIAY